VREAADHTYQLFPFGSVDDDGVEVEKTTEVARDYLTTANCLVTRLEKTSDSLN
jgi:hypothetical protein